MNLLFAAAPNPFDVKAALLAGHAQHPVTVHFPIALFIASAVFDVLAIWRKQPLLAVVAYFNLVGAAITVPLAIALRRASANRSERGFSASRIVSHDRNYLQSRCLHGDNLDFRDHTSARGAMLARTQREHADQR